MFIYLSRVIKTGNNKSNDSLVVLLLCNSYSTTKHIDFSKSFNLKNRLSLWTKKNQPYWINWVDFANNLFFVYDLHFLLHESNKKKIIQVCIVKESKSTDTKWILLWIHRFTRFDVVLYILIFIVKVNLYKVKHVAFYFFLLKKDFVSKAT